MPLDGCPLTVCHPVHHRRKPAALAVDMSNNYYSFLLAARLDPAPLQQPPKQSTAAVGLRPKAFLVSHGSFNPPHRGHVEMMEMARQCVEAAGYCVEAAYLALTCTSHIAAKGAPAMTDEARKHCCDLLIRCLGYSEWMRCDVRGVDYQSGNRMIKQLLSEEQNGATGFSVIGADVYERYYNHKKDYKSTVVVARAGTEMRPGCTALRINGCEGTQELSSTQVRAAMLAREGSSLQQMVGTQLAEYLLGLGEDTYLKARPSIFGLR